MTTPAPELRKLYLRVIRRIHPDGAIDDQDRLRCERLTQQANHAYAAGDEAALRTVLEPKLPWHGWYLRWSAGRRFVIWWNALKIKPWQVAGAAIAFALVCCYIIIAVRPPKYDAVASCGSAATGRYQIAHDEHAIFSTDSFVNTCCANAAAHNARYKPPAKWNFMGRLRVQ